MKRKQWFLIAALCIGVLMLSGCGIPTEGVDVRETAPDGYWQSLVVWPLANGLIWLNGTFLDMGIPHNWGFAIITFTLIIKLLTFPLTVTQIRGMEAQKKIQPRLQELQKKYGKDKERMAQEQMKLYKEAGVNPLSGCLPLVVQMPVLFGLYSALIALGAALQDATFYWIPDLGFPKYTAGLSWISESYNESDYATLAAYLVLPALLVVSQFIMQKWMTPTPTAPSTPAADGQPDMSGMMKQMGLIMTFMFGFFTLQVPAGLTLYWVTSNLLQMLQQWLITSNKLTLGSAAPVQLSTAAVSPDGAMALSDPSTVVIDGKAVDSRDYGSVPAKKQTSKGGSKKKRKSKRR